MSPMTASYSALASVPFAFAMANSPCSPVAVTLLVPKVPMLADRELAVHRARVRLRPWPGSRRQDPLQRGPDRDQVAVRLGLHRLELVNRPLLPLISAMSVASRSFCRSWATGISCAPSLASCSVLLNWLALFSASATRRPPKTSPMSRAATITAKSRRATGQSVKVRFSCRF